MVCSCLFDPTALMTFSDPSQFSVFQVEPRAAVRASATLLTKYAGLDFAAPWKHQSFTRYATISPSHPAALIKAVFYIFSGLALVSALAFQVTCQPQILLQRSNLKSQNWTTKNHKKRHVLWFSMILVAVSDAWSIRIAIAVLFSLLFPWFVMICLSSILFCVNVRHWGSCNWNELCDSKWLPLC